MIMYTQDGDSKYVANILSNMANGGDRSVQVTVSFFHFCIVNFLAAWIWQAWVFISHPVLS